jgi:hypothetical protein
MLVRLLELSWWFYIHDEKQLHEVIYMTSETPNRHRAGTKPVSQLWAEQYRWWVVVSGILQLKGDSH